MNNLLKMTTASMLLMSATQANANDLLAEINNSVAKGLQSYTLQLSGELKQFIATTTANNLALEAKTLKAMRVKAIDAKPSNNNEQSKHINQERKHEQ